MMQDALLSDGPSVDLAAELGLFGQLVGSWRLAWTGYGPGGEPFAVAEGELHAGWVLGGRAVQDVWIVPGPGQPGHDVPPHAFHGTTLRFYDPSLRAWRSTWIEPLNGRVRAFIGRPTADGAELISDDQSPQLRWRFTDLTADGFTWIGERRDRSSDPWQREEVMVGSRTSG